MRSLPPRRARWFLVVFFATSAGAGEAVAFDDSRDGFVLGFGAGLGAAAGPVQDELHAGLYTNLKIGYGFTPRLVLQYSGMQFWYLSEDLFLTQAIPTAAIAWYTSERARTYLTVGGGASIVWSDRYGDFELQDSGIAIMGGWGYEVKQHWQVELTAAASFVSGELEWGNVAVTLGYLAY